MKKQILILSALFIVAFFTACEQDSLISTDVTEEVIAEHSLEIEPELPPEFAALINNENSGEIDDRCSFNGKIGTRKIGYSGYPGIYSGEYRVSAENNPFMPANQIVDYRVRVWQKTDGGIMVLKEDEIEHDTRLLSWESKMYYNTNGNSRWVYFLVEARNDSCNDWKFIGNNWENLKDSI